MKTASAVYIRARRLPHPAAHRPLDSALLLCQLSLAVPIPSRYAHSNFQASMLVYAVEATCAWLRAGVCLCILLLSLLVADPAPHIYYLPHDVPNIELVMLVLQLASLAIQVGEYI